MHRVIAAVRDFSLPSLLFWILAMGSFCWIMDSVRRGLQDPRREVPVAVAPAFVQPDRVNVRPGSSGPPVTWKVKCSGSRQVT